MFWRKKRKKNKKISLSSLQFDHLPILNCAEITQLLVLQKKIESIKGLVSIGDAHFKSLYLPAINQYLESVQLAPASASHHHSGPGGLAIHTFDVIETSLRRRKAYNLPEHSTSEIIAAQEHVWTYGVFAGALLHDIGKMVCSTQLLLDGDQLWTPHDKSILETGANFYQVKFIKSPYKLHTLLSNGFLHLLPPVGRGWLSQYPDILAQLTAWLSGDIYAYGRIGEIIRWADSASVASNLKIGGDRKRFPNAPTIPMVDRITTALRQLLDEGKLKINRPDGSSGWCDDRYVYLVCGTVANAVRDYLRSSGATDIPTDNSILFDIWQEHDFILSTPEGGSIWQLTINKILHLTVLKFEISRLFHPSHYPAPFAGDLYVSDKADNEYTDKRHTNNTENDVNKVNKPEQKTEIKDKNQDSTVSAIDDDTGSDYDVLISAKKSTHPDTSQDIIPELTKSAPAQFDLNDPDLPHYFLDWLRTGIRDGKIASNRSDALVHVVPEGALVVSPLAFKQFAHQNNLLNADNNENDATKKIQNKLEKLMRKTKLHRKTARGLNIHTYLIQGARRTVKIRGWLLPIPTVYGDIKPPEINPALTNVSKFLAPKEESTKNI